jgi:hypothetical protein
MSVLEGMTMTRDAFDRFQPRERGRFGDNERASARLGRGSDPERLVDFEHGKLGPLRLCVDRPGSGSIAVVRAGDDRGAPLIWLPRKSIQYRAIGGGLVEVTMPEWLALDRGLI